jgi:hypothetical protein
MLARLLRHPACVSPDRSLAGTTRFRADLSLEVWKVRFRPGLSPGYGWKLSRMPIRAKRNPPVDNEDIVHKF